MFVKNITAFILFSSIFIAICAVSLTLESGILLHVPFNNLSFYLFVFGATLAQYNLHYMVKTTAVSHSERLAWSVRNKNLHKILFVLGCILILISFFSFKLHHFIILSILGAIAFLYSFPVIPFGEKKRIKDYGFLKIITLALLWTLVTVWFPVSNMNIDRNIFLFVFCKRFVFMFILCLLFDIRDVEIDKKENIKTIPVVTGVKRSYIIVNILLAFFTALSVLQYIYLHDSNVSLAMIVSAVATFLAVEFTKKSNSDFIYLAGIDGMMLLQAALVYLFTLKL